MIATMISGRLKEPATRRLTDKSKTLTTAQMIATDDGNRAQLVLLETLDDDIGRSLRLLLAGASLTVTGAATVLPLGQTENQGANGDHDRVHSSWRIADCKPFQFARPIDQFLAFRGESI